MKAAVQIAASSHGRRGRTPSAAGDSTVAEPAPTLRAALIGCEARARLHSRAYGPVERAHIESVCDLDPDRARTFASEIAAKSWHCDLDALLETAPDIS